MDDSHLPSDNLETILSAYLDEIIKHGDHNDINDVLEILDPLYGCECGCRGRQHPRLARQILHEVTQLRNRIIMTTLPLSASNDC